MAKILYICESIAPFVTGGMQEVARRHIQYLRDYGHEVVGLHSRIENEKEYSDSIDMVKIPWPDEDKNYRWRYPGRYAHLLQLYSKKLVLWVKKEKPDIIYSEGPVVKALLQMQDRPPIIFHPHGLEVFQPVLDRLDRFRLYPLKLLITDHCLRSDIVISQGGRLTDILTHKVGVESTKIRILPNSYSGTLGQTSSPESYRFLFVGRNEKRKGLAGLLDVFATLPHLYLDVVGEKQHPGATSNIQFHGVIRDRLQLNSFFQKAHALIVPSISEGMPTVILEAMSQGTPVIATDVGATADLVTTRQTGWLIKPGETGQLKLSIQQAASIETVDYRTMSEHCINLIRDNFSETTVKSLLCALIQEVIENYQKHENTIYR